MMDTEASRGIADSLPLTSLALDGALLRWGLFDSAMAKVGFYFKTFVFENGTIDMVRPCRDLTGASIRLLFLCDSIAFRC